MESTIKNPTIKNPNKDSIKKISSRSLNIIDDKKYNLSSEIKSFYDISEWDTKNVTDIPLNHF